MQLLPIPAFTDNYIWLLHDARHAVVVDPGQAEPVLQALTERGLQLQAILVTHHHGDHVGGVDALRNALGALSRGDLTTVIEQTFAPEYEQLRDDFNKAMATLLTAMRGVLDSGTLAALEIRSMRSSKISSASPISTSGSSWVGRSSLSVMVMLRLV